jgi:uncharacterized protein (TIGR02145 family)
VLLSTEFDKNRFLSSEFDLCRFSSTEVDFYRFSSTEGEFGRQTSNSLDRNRHNNNFNKQTMKKINLFLLLALPFFAGANLRAQVTMGGLTEPAAGAILDLNSTVKGGLLLSNVTIVDWELIPQDANVFPGITDVDVNLSLRGAMVYNTGTATVPQGIYIWNGCRWTQDGSYGTALTSSSYSATAVDGNSVTLSVTGSGCPTLSYQWFSNLSASNSGGEQISGETGDTYTTPALSHSVGTYYYYCEVTSSLNGSKAVSDVFTVKVNIDPATIPFGSGRLTGKTCLDVALGNTAACGTLPGRESQKINFTDRTGGAHSGVQTYTFTPSGTVSNVRFEYIEEEGSSIESITPGGVYSGNVNYECTVVVSYRTALQTELAGKARDNGNKLKLYAVYNNQAGGGGSDERVALSISLQDCSCCGAFVNDGKWLNFMCYNLGADENADPFTPSAAISGARYKWGTKVAALTQAEDLDETKYYSGFSNWNSRGGTSLYNASSEWDLENANPCPSGWRVPTYDEWEAVINIANNPQLFSTLVNEGGVYTFTGWASSISGWPSPVNYWVPNYACAIKIGDALVLPASGYRHVTAGALTSYDRSCGHYWTTRSNGSTYSFYLFFGRNGGFVEGAVQPQSGLNVRCVAE